MSQCGAVGYANERGMNYKKILKHYYTGTSIGKAGRGTSGLFGWLSSLFGYRTGIRRKMGKRASQTGRHLVYYISL